MFAKKTCERGLAALMILAISVTSANADSSAKRKTSAMLTVTLDPANTGTISGDGIDCPGVCVKTVDTTAASSIMLRTSSFSPEYMLDHWEINNTDAGKDPASLVVNFPANSTLNQAVKAVFRKFQPTDVIVTVSSSTGGSVSGSGMSCLSTDLCQKIFSKDTILKLAATPAEQYVFAYWLIDDVKNGTSPSLSLSLSEFASQGPFLTKNIRAVFEPAVMNRITLSVSPSGSGRVSGGGFPCTADSYQMDFAPVVTPAITLTADDDMVYDFDYWKVNDVVLTPSQSSLTISTSSPASVVAVFKHKTISAFHTLSISVKPGGQHSVSAYIGRCGNYYSTCRECDMTFPAGLKIRLVANYSVGSKDHFLGWDGAEASPDSLLEAYVTMVGNKSVTANFQPIPISPPAESPVTPPVTPPEKQPETSGGGGCFVEAAAKSLF